MDGSIKVGEAATTTPAGLPKRAIRNIALLAICQALTQGSNTLMFASSALAVLTIVSPDMRMFANLRGVPEHCIEAVVEDLTEKLLLRDHIDKQVKELR